jgi:hypothetical protein
VAHDRRLALERGLRPPSGDARISRSAPEHRPQLATIGASSAAAIVTRLFVIDSTPELRQSRAPHVAESRAVAGLSGRDLAPRRTRRCLVREALPLQALAFRSRIRLADDAVARAGTVLSIDPRPDAERLTRSGRMRANREQARAFLIARALPRRHRGDRTLLTRGCRRRARRAGRAVFAPLAGSPARNDGEERQRDLQRDLARRPLAFGREGLARNEPRTRDAICVNRGTPCP